MSAIRGATPPTRNNLSHANKVRDAVMAEKLFWAVYAHLGDMSPKFVSGKAAKRFARKFKRTIHVVDSTTIQLIASCMDWAKHRRRKAAAKCHLRLDLQSFLPRFAIIDTARDADAKRAREVCAGIKDGEIVIFDRAYVDFDASVGFDQRGVFWVTRAKENLQFEVVERYPVKEGGKIVSDELVGLANAGSRQAYPELMRRVVAWVEVDGQERLMTFLTNQLTWSRGEHRGILPVPLADRSLLQADQADLAVGGLSGHQRQRRAVAGLDGLVGLSVAPLFGLSLRLVA